MNKRSDTIRSLFAQPPSPLLSADNRASELPRVAAGAVKSIRDTFSSIERENDSLRVALANADQILHIPAEAISPSPFADRFSEEQDPAFELLLRSIEERGQEVPVLVRPHPTAPGRYEAAYGHRRIRAAKQLGRPVKAIVQNLSDDELVVAQGLENSAREDLSFIERAMFAFHLEQTGRSRTLIQQALAVDKAEASKLIAVARAVPRDVATAIGKAAKAGRPRWLEFADALKSPDAAARVRATISGPDFRRLDADQRFLRALAASRAPRRKAGRQRELICVTDAAGTTLAQVEASRRTLRVAWRKPGDSGFARFLAERLPSLLEEYAKTPAETN